MGLKNKNLKPESITSRDIALFEAGIKLGAMYHQFTGTPVSLKSAKTIEKAIEESISLQPYVTSVSVSLDKKLIEELASGNAFEYTEISGKMINAEIELSYGSVCVVVFIAFDEKTCYPLMQIKSIESRIDSID